MIIIINNNNNNNNNLFSTASQRDINLDFLW